MKLIFVRHGEPDYAHDCLTENGRIQAAATAQRLKGEGISAVYASSNGRAVETASYTAKEYGLEVQKLDFMHEINWGDKNGSEYEKLPYNGHPWTLGYKLLTEYPEYADNKGWAEHHFFRDNVCMDYFGLISENIDKLLLKYGLERRNSLYYCRKENNDNGSDEHHPQKSSFSGVYSSGNPYISGHLPSPGLREKADLCFSCCLCCLLCFG